MLAPATGWRWETDSGTQDGGTRSRRGTWTFPLKVSIPTYYCWFSSNECLNGKLSASSRSQREWPRDTSIEGKAEEQRCHLLQLPLFPRSSQPPTPLPQLCPIGFLAQGEPSWCCFKAGAQGLCYQWGLAGSTRRVGTGLPVTRLMSFLWNGDRVPQAPTLDVPAATPLRRLHQEE